MRIPVAAAINAYANGWFPMDDASEPELPWYAPDPRAVFDLEPEALAATRRTVRRSLARDPGWMLKRDRNFAEVLAACAQPREPESGVWITPRLAELYGDLHAAGWAHSYELHDETGWLAGLLAVRVRNAAMLESMTHRRPHAGNVLVVRTLERLVEEGVTVCDVQLLTDHTERLGALEIPRAEYERRLAAALS